MLLMLLEEHPSASREIFHSTFCLSSETNNNQWALFKYTKSGQFLNGSNDYEYIGISSNRTCLIIEAEDRAALFYIFSPRISPDLFYHKPFTLYT